MTLKVSTATPPKVKPTVPEDGITDTGKKGMLTAIFVPPKMEPVLTETTGVPITTWFEAGSYLRLIDIGFTQL